MIFWKPIRSKVSIIFSAKQNLSLHTSWISSALDQKRESLVYAEQRFSEGRFNEQNVLNFKNEVERADIEMELQKIKTEAHVQNLEMQLKHQELILKQLEREKDQKF